MQTEPKISEVADQARTGVSVGPGRHIFRQKDQQLHPGDPTLKTYTHPSSSPQLTGPHHPSPLGPRSAVQNIVYRLQHRQEKRDETSRPSHLHPQKRIQKSTLLQFGTVRTPPAEDFSLHAADLQRRDPGPLTMMNNYALNMLAINSNLLIQINRILFWSMDYDYLASAIKISIPSFS